MKTKSFALSTLAVLIQTLITTTQAEAVEHNLENTRYVDLEDNTREITWKASRLTVAETIMPIWEKDRVHRKLDVITTGEGENGNLIVKGSYGIRTWGEDALGYVPEVLIKSNNDIIFKNDFQGAQIQSNSGNITLEAKNKINFNLNIADKTKNFITDQEVLVNDKGLIEYRNNEGNKSDLLLKSAKGNLLNMTANIHKDTRHFGIKNLYNNNVNLTATEGDNVISIKGNLVDPIDTDTEVQSKSYLSGIETGLNSNTTLTGENNKIEIKTTGEGLGFGANDINNNNSYSDHTSGIFVIGQHTKPNYPKFTEKSSVKLKATKGNNEINVEAKSHSILKGIIVSSGSIATLEATDDNIVKVKNPDKNTKLMKKPFDTPRIGLQSSVDSDIVLDGKNNIVELAGNPIYQSGISTDGDSTVTLTAKEDNKITVENAVVGSEGIATLVTNAGDKQSKRGTGNQVILEAGNDNIITMKANDEDMSIADASTVLKETKSYTEKSGSKGLFSYGKNSLIKLTGKNNIIKSELTEKVKEFKHYGLYAETHGKIELTAVNNEVKGAMVGLYTNQNSSITLNGTNNLVETSDYGLHAFNNSTQSLTAIEQNKVTGQKYGIYANDNSSVSLTASNNIINSTNVGISSLNNATVDVNGQIKLSSKIANYASKEGSIKLNYANKSEITGATLSNGGNIAIKPLDFSTNTMALTGDVLSVNKGKVELNLTPNSHLVGRLDNFAKFDHPEHKNLFNRYINDLDAKSAGTINLNLAKDALWTMTGQSWLDKLEGQGTIDFNNDAKASGRSLHIGELAGANKFLMHLNKDGAHSDMIYVKKGTTTPQDVTITNLSEVLDMMNYGDRLRFATIQENSGNEFIDGKRYIDDSHLMEQALTVEYSDHQSDPSNKPDYNLAFNGDKMTAEKAGNADVDAMYNGEHRKNVYLVKKKLNPDCNCNNPSKGVKDVTGMFDSTAHYAFTLDTYTKREGERAYSSLDKKDGAWVRAVHTKLTQSGVFRFHNNDYEIGYDKFSRNDTEKKRKWGLSFTYGRAKLSLSNQFSKGRIKKYELSFYNTNQRQNKEGDDSAYHDNVLRIGLLRSHSYASMNNGKLWGKGSYRNKYFTVSTEYGYRKFINDDKRWYVVPQAQLQFTYLNGVDYKLSNGVNVSLNHTKSLIGRVGIDIVRLLDDEREQKDLRERRFYIKGNILHEFLAKRSFIGSYSADNYSKTWNNRGTWYAIGLGYNAHVSEKTYIFIDAERELGAGRANSYNARLAISWQFK